MTKLRDFYKETSGKLYIKLIMLSLGIALWLFANAIINSPYKMDEFIQAKIFNPMHLTSVEPIETTIITALFCAVATFFSLWIMFASLTAMCHEKPVFECARKHMRRYFAFWGCAVTEISSMSWYLLWSQLPVKSHENIHPIFDFDPILRFAFYSDTIALACAALVCLGLTYAYSFGVFKNSNIYFNIVCAALWCVFAYKMLNCMIVYFEYGKWFLCFMVLCYVFIAIHIWVYKVKDDAPLIPKYEILVIDLEDFEDAEDYDHYDYGKLLDDTADDKEYDFSFFMPIDDEQKED